MALEIISQEYNSDKLSCLPLQFTITNVFYNKDAFEAAGPGGPHCGRPLDDG